eukprot:gene8057-9467_t
MQWYRYWKLNILSRSKLNSIDNSLLLIPGNEDGSTILNPRCVEGQHFAVVPASTWDYFSKYYGCQPVIARKVVKQFNRSNINYNYPVLDGQHSTVSSLVAIDSFNALNGHSLAKISIDEVKRLLESNQEFRQLVDKHKTDAHHGDTLNDPLDIHHLFQHLQLVDQHTKSIKVDNEPHITEHRFTHDVDKMDKWKSMLDVDLKGHVRRLDRFDTRTGLTTSLGDPKYSVISATTFIIGQTLYIVGGNSGITLGGNHQSNTNHIMAIDININSTNILTLSTFISPVFNHDNRLSNSQSPVDWSQCWNDILKIYLVGVINHLS